MLSETLIPDREGINQVTLVPARIFEMEVEAEVLPAISAFAPARWPSE